MADVTDARVVGTISPGRSPACSFFLAESSVLVEVGSRTRRGRASRISGFHFEVYSALRAFSERQLWILGLYLRGRNDKEIAWELPCSESTVYEHGRRIAKKANGAHKGCVINDFHRFLSSL